MRPRALPALATGSLLTITLAACGDSGGAAAGGAPESGSTGAGGTTSSRSATSKNAPAYTLQGDSVSFVDGSGKQVTVPRNPKTVVATDWSAIRTLGGFGVQVKGSPKPNGALPQDVSTAVQGSTQVGDLFEPNYERISALKPDLIVVGSRSGSPKVVAEMKKITPNVIDASVRSDNAADVLPMSQDRAMQLGAVFGKETQARQAVSAIDTRIATIKPKAAAAGTAMFVQTSAGKVSAYGPGSRFGMIYDPLGFRPTNAPVKDKGSHGEEISQEFFARYNPGVIFALDRGKVVGDDAQPAGEVLSGGLIGATDAAKNDKIVTVDGFAWYLATTAPASINAMLDDVEKAL